MHHSPPIVQSFKTNKACTHDWCPALHSTGHTASRKSSCDLSVFPKDHTTEDTGCITACADNAEASHCNASNLMGVQQSLDHGSQASQPFNAWTNKACTHRYCVPFLTLPSKGHAAACDASVSHKEAQKTAHTQAMSDLC
jgi:hypothetical protein